MNKKEQNTGSQDKKRRKSMKLESKKVLFCILFSIGMVLPLIAGATQTPDWLSNILGGDDSVLLASVTKVYNYTGGTLTSVSDLKNGQEVYYVCGNQAYAVRLVPSQDILEDEDLQDEIDADDDGEVSSEEWAAYCEEYYAQVMERYDDNGDGIISNQEAQDMVAAEDTESTVQVTYFVYDEENNGELEYTYSYERDSNGDTIEKDGDIEDGVVNGLAAKITFMENGKRSRIIGWVPGDPEDADSDLVMAEGTFNYSDENTLESYEGNLSLVGISYTDVETGEVVYNDLGQEIEVYDDEGNLVAENEFDAYGNNTITHVYENNGEDEITRITRVFKGSTVIQLTTESNDGDGWEVDDTSTWYAVLGLHDQILMTIIDYEADFVDENGDPTGETQPMRYTNYQLFGSQVFTTNEER